MNILLRLPVEIDLGGVYLPPVLLAVIAGVGMAMAITHLLNRLDLVRFIWYPPLFFLALSVICTCLAGCLVFPFVVPPL